MRTMSRPTAPRVPAMSATHRAARREPGRLDLRHIPARAFDAEHVDLGAEQVAHARLHGCVAAAVQDELRVAAEQTGRIDAERNVAVDALRGVERNRGLGVTIVPGALHSRSWIAPSAVSILAARHQPVRRGLLASSCSACGGLIGSGGRPGRCGCDGSPECGTGSRTSNADAAPSWAQVRAPAAPAQARATRTLAGGWARALAVPERNPPVARKSAVHRARALAARADTAGCSHRSRIAALAVTAIAPAAAAPARASATLALGARLRATLDG